MVLNVPTGSASWTTFFTPEASQITLANLGDKLKVTWTFKPSTVNASNSSQNFRIALVDTPGADRITTDAPPNNSTYTGYAIFGNMGNTTGNGNSFQLKKRSVLTSSDILGTSGNWGTALGNGLGNGAVGYFSGVTYTFVLQVTRNNSNGLDLLTSMTGGSGAQAIGGTGSVSVSATDTSPNSFTFDTLSLRPSSAASTAASFDTTLFQVDYITAAVPEVSSFFMVGLVGAGWLTIRSIRTRRTRKEGGGVEKSADQMAGAG
jgi:hypothetical protein